MVKTSLYHLKEVGFFPLGVCRWKLYGGGELSSQLSACTALPGNSNPVPSRVSQLAVTLLPEDPVHLASSGACTYIYIATHSLLSSLPPSLTAPLSPIPTLSSNIIEINL